MDLLTYEQKQLPWYRTMRDKQPVHYREREQLWEVFRYNDVREVLSNPEIFSSEFRQEDDADQPLRTTLISSDPPRHTELRGLVARDFTPRGVARLAPRITQIANELLDQVTPVGQMDVVTAIAEPLPVMVIAELLGIPPEERARFKAWSDVVISGSLEERQQARRRDVHGAAAVARDEMLAYFEEAIAQRRRQPRDDLISNLIAARINGQALSQQELLGFCILLLVAGNITTTNLITNAVICFDEHPEVIEWLRAEPKLLTGAVEEVLRYRSPVHFLFRIAKTNVRLGDQEIQAGQAIMPWVASANRDEAEFPEPDRFDIERTPNRHLSFGHDIHFCLGAHLSRLETRIALSAMLERLPGMRRVPNTPLEMIDSAFIYGVKRLPITFAPSAVGAVKEPIATD
jgi:cytochrome P450